MRSTNQDVADVYKNVFDSLIKEYDLSACQIYNADETGLLWFYLPNSTLAAGDEKCAKSFKEDKNRLAVLLCGNVSRDQILTSFVIGKSISYLKIKNLRGSNQKLLQSEKTWFY